MSVGRLAEPPKPSFLLLSKVSQSHPFMCNACKSMHSDTTAQQRDMEGGGREWTAIKMGQSRQAPQDNNSIQNINIQQRQEQQEPHWLQTLRRAEEQHGELLVTGSARR